jgi:hypothetical protein
MTTLGHDASKPRRRWPTYLAIVLVLLLIVYPLSAGPAWVVAYECNNDFVYQTVSIAYEPVNMVMMKLPRLNGTYYRYLEWWLRVTNTSNPPQGSRAGQGA